MGLHHQLLACERPAYLTAGSWSHGSRCALHFDSMPAAKRPVATGYEVKGGSGRGSAEGLSRGYCPNRAAVPSYRSRPRLSAVTGRAIAALGRERACHLVARQVVAAEELDMRRGGLIWMKERRHCLDAGAGLLPVLG
jgi:hypothetical protein